MAPRPARWIRLVVGAALVALLVGRWLADHTAERLWARSLGVAQAHGSIANVRLMLLALAFLAAALWCIGNVYLFYRSIGSVHVPRRVGNIEFLEAVPRRYLLIGAVVIGLLLAVVVSHDAGDWWTAQTLLDEGASVGVREPILNLDLGYYLFVLPWFRTLHGFVTVLTGTMLAVIALLYAGVGAIRWTRRRLHVSELARMHLAGLFAAFALALFWGYRLEPAEYVAGIHGVPLDATLLDVRIPVARLLAVLGLVAAAVSFAWLWIPSVGMMSGIWTVLIVVSLVGHYALPAFSASVKEGETGVPPELDHATTEMERIAFGLEHRDNTLETPGPRDIRTLANRRSQLKSAAIWDPAQVIAALNLLRAENPDHAKFFAASLGLYRNAKGQPVPAYLSAREVDLARAREANVLNWETEHTIPYGHSSGLVAVAGDGAAEDGSPLFLPSLEPADSAVSHLTDVRQSDGNIFFSPAAGDFAVVSASAGEYVGVPAGGIARRIALAWALQSPRLLTSDLLTPDVLILWERQIGPRLARYAPFARFGAPYPVFNGGRLYWMASGYLSAEAFPLSRAIRWDGEVSRYLRAGLVGVVEARSGATSVYLMPAPDPLSSAWARRLPEIVRPFSELPAGLAQHLRYPEGLFDVQVALIHGPPATVQPPDPRRNRPLWWSGPWAADTVSRLRIIARFEPDTANTVSGLITGTLVAGTPALDVVHFTQAADLAGPAEVVKRLADTRGVPAVGVIGTRHAVLLGDGLLSVQSAYATGNGPPRLADVIVQWGPILARGRNLGAAVDGALAVPDNGGIGADWASAKRWFDRLEQARQRGDWTAFGRAYDALRRLLSGQ